VKKRFYPSQGRRPDLTPYRAAGPTSHLTAAQLQRGDLTPPLPPSPPSHCNPPTEVLQLHNCCHSVVY